MRCPSWIVSKSAVKRLLVLAALLVVFLAGAYLAMIRMPGRSHDGPLPPLTDAEAALARDLERHVVDLAWTIGPRSLMHGDSLDRAAAHLTGVLEEAGLDVLRQEFDVGSLGRAANLWVEIPGRSSPDEIVVVGAHYDTVGLCPGANDNGTGVAATLELARRFANAPQDRTLRFALFANEEPPFFTTDDMGSLHLARKAAEDGDAIVAMLSLETIGCYLDEPGSQQYPPPLSLVYPSRGNFIAFVGNFASRKLVRTCVGTFRERVAFPSEGAALPSGIPGIGWSDHWSFWQAGYPAVMVTDTAPFRYPHYHTQDDTPEKIDYERMARVVKGLEPVIETLATP